MNLGGLIPLLGGICCLFIGFRVVSGGKNPDAKETYVKKYGLLLKLGGVVCVVFWGDINSFNHALTFANAVSRFH